MNENVPSHIRDGGTAPEPRPDDAILVLGLKLREAWVAQIRLHELLRDDHSDEADAACDASYDRISALVDQIDAEPASTFLGACIKALAYCWCEAHQLPPDPDKTDYPSRDDRLVASVRRALLMMSASTLPEGSR